MVPTRSAGRSTRFKERIGTGFSRIAITASSGSSSLSVLPGSTALTRIQNSPNSRAMVRVNPISALSHATLVEICQFPETRQLAADMMREAEAVANKLGIKFRHTIEKRIEGAEAVGAHKTSMLQDVELGRSLETEALVGSILELARLTETPAPSIQAVYACVKLLNKVMLTEGGGVRLSKAA